MAGKIIMTGAKGFLGKVLSEGLTRQGYELYTIGRQSSNSLQADIAYETVQLPDLGQVDMVLHAAGKAHFIPRSKAEEQEFFDVNFAATKNLFESIVKAGIKPLSFVFISTVSVYGVDRGELIDEDHPLLGTTPYAKSKIMAEEWLKEHASMHGVKLSVLRLPLVAGPNPPGNLGAMINGMKKGRYFSIGDANAKKSIVWAADIAKILPAVAEKGGVFNLTDCYDPTFGELEAGLATAMNRPGVMKIPYFAAKLLAIIGDIVGNRAPINSDKLKKLTSSLTFDSTRAKKILNWCPAKVLDKLPEMI